MGVLGTATLVFAVSAAAILVVYLVRRPKLGGAVKVWLLMGIGVLPLGAAFTGNISGFQTTTTRSFCASCHTMDRFANDAADPEIQSLSAMHSRNAAHGSESCYNCHRDYEMFGTVTTKLAGLKHVWVFYTGGANNTPKLYDPFTNSACTQCHSMTLAGWKDEPEHGAVAAELVTGEATCVTSGCHGPAHPVKETSAR